MLRRLSILRDIFKNWSEDEALLRSSPLFDEKYYQEHAQISTLTNAAAHYLNVGWKRLLNPSHHFNTKFYLNTYPDIRNSKIAPLLHYLKDGFREMRRPCAEFDPIKFTKTHGKLDSQNPAEVCLQIYGSYAWAFSRPAESLDHTITSACKALFDPKYYQSMYCEIDWSTNDPFFHYMEYGHLQNCDPFIEFNSEYYRQTWMRNARNWENPLAHYVTNKSRQNQSLDDPEAMFLKLGVGSAVREDTPSLCIHAHCFYPEMLGEILPALEHAPAKTHLIVTVVTKADLDFANRYITRSGVVPSFDVRLVANQGRDLIPFIIGSAELWRSYDLVLHIHTKKSAHIEWGSHWRAYLFDQLFGSREIVKAVLDTFASDPKLGMLYPANFHRIKEYLTDEVNQGSIDTILKKLGLFDVPQSRNFAAGSMAFFRTDALVLAADRLKEVAVEDEADQLDGTIAHALERALPLVIRAQGLKVRNYKTPIRSRVMAHPSTQSRSGFSAPIGKRWVQDTPAISRTPPETVDPGSHCYNSEQLDIHWILPSFNGPGFGGHMTIFRMVRYLEQFGHRQTVWLQNAVQFEDQAEARKRIRHWYQPIGDQVHVLFLPDDMRALSGDVLIATDCWTAFPAAAATNFKERFYFIQDYEPDFYPAGERQLIAKMTYTFGFACLCAGNWLLKQATERGNWARAWDLSSDPVHYFPASQPRTLTRPISIAFYARQHTPRRAVRLGLAALDTLYERGTDIYVHLFGEDGLDFKLPFAHEHHGVMSPQALGDLYRACDIGVVFSATNYSLVPLEMMACGLPVVELDVPSTRAIFQNNEVTFASPTPYAIADAIDFLAEDKVGRAAQIERASRFVAGFSWKASARKIEAAIFERLGEVGALPMDAGVLAAPAIHQPRKVSVFIPTYNAGPELEHTMEAISSQVCDFDYDVLVIDSGSTDGTPDLVKRFAHRNVRLNDIASAEFQHGRTRNLGLERTDGAYVAILTQDARPKNSDWLANLIAGFSRAPNVAGVIGRHEAYPDHDLFTRRDTATHFDTMAVLPDLMSYKFGLPSFLYPGSEPWRMQLNFYSDNNSAMSRAIWRILPYPEVDWGEDQVWAAEMLRLGFAKVYVDEAIVYHSHVFDLKKQFDVAEIEGRFWATRFGIRLHGDADVAIAAMNARDQDFAIRNGVSARSLKRRLKVNEATVKGRLAGWKKATPFLQGP